MAGRATPAWREQCSEMASSLSARPSPQSDTNLCRCSSRITRHSPKRYCPAVTGRLMFAVPVRLTILGSGSAGNCAYVETEEARILIDAGFSLRQIRKRMAAIGRAPENLTAVLVTHEHSDHVNGLPALNQKLHLPVFCNRPTKEAIEFQLQTKLECSFFQTRHSFEVGDVTVETFEVLHDAQDPVGFLLRAPGVNIGFLTDLGQVTKLVLDRLRFANVLVLESNHDIKMLQDS